MEPVSSLLLFGRRHDGPTAGHLSAVGLWMASLLSCADKKRDVTIHMDHHVARHTPGRVRRSLACGAW